MNGGGSHGFFKNRLGGGAEESRRREWLAAAAEGDQAAFSLLYQEFSKRIYGYLKLRIQQEGDIQDLMQDIFVTIWRNAARYAGLSSVSTWIFGIARNKLLDWLRVRYRSAQWEIPWTEEHDETPERVEPDFADIAVNELSLASALATLPPHDQELFYLVFVESMSYKEIGVLLGIQEGTVKSRMHQVKTRLRQHLQEGGSRDG